MTPRVSFIIPAFNAERTLIQALESVLAQTFSDWEAIVVDDGSTDGTAALAADFAARDGRIRLISQANGGVSAARNRGLAEAGGELGVFLDADDSILPEHLARLVPLAAPDRAATCASSYLTPEGRRLPAVVHTGLDTTPVALLSDFCAMAVHSVVVPLEAVRAAGGFDTTLRTCEDWDLWLRLARSGMAFATVPDALSLYHMHATSLSSDRPRLLDDAETVIRRARAPDPRLPRDVSVPADLTPVDEAIAIQVFWYACTVAAVSGAIPDWYAARLPEGPMRLTPERMRDCVVSALVVGAQTDGADLSAQWTVSHAAITSMLRALEARGSPGLTAATLYPFELWIVRQNALPAPLVFSQVAGVNMDVAELRDLEFDSGIGLAHLRVTRFGQDIARLELPVWSRLPARVILARLFELFPRADLKAWGAIASVPDLRKLYIQETLHQVKKALTGKGRPSRHAAYLGALRRLDGDDGLSELVGKTGIDIMLRAKADGAAEPVAAEIRVQSHKAPAGSGYQDADFWETWFARENPWRYDSGYEQRKYEQTLSLLDGLTPENALELASAEGHFTRQLAPRVGKLLATDISATALQRCEARCEGLANVDFKTVDVLNDVIPGDKDLIVVSEMLYYLEDRERLKTVAGKIAGALNPGGRVLTAHAFLVSDDPDAPGFDWDLPYGAATIAETFGATPGLKLEKSLRSDLYRIDLWRKSDDDIAADIQEGGYDIPAPAVLRTLFPDGQRPGVAEARQAPTRTVPVLMYHRVADTDGPLKRYAVTPRQFDDQLRMLKSFGFHSLTSAEFAWYREGHAPLKGRPIMLTFDDAYQDFADNAFSRLQRWGFSAEVFVVTDKTGQAADWDAHYGPPAPLMDWTTIGRLSEAGIAFGSHLATHRAADSLTSSELLYEAVKSRETLQARLGKDIRSIAAPYGNLDERAQRIFHYAGYAPVFTTEDGMATLDHPLNRLPRIEVHDEMDADALAARLGLQ
jgi:peptidoglycan/xylan/chitin deacetylase (PgdA/CDA1 family)